MTHLLPAIAWTLIHFCWQAASIAALYGIANLVLARRSSQARYLLAVAAVLAMLVSAVATFAWQFRADRVLSRNAGDPSIELAAFPNQVRQASIPGPVRDLAENKVESSITAGIPSLLSPSLLSWIDSFWLVGVFVLSFRSLGGWIRMRRLCTSATPNVPSTARATFDRLAAAFGLRRSVDLAASNSVSGPFTVGFLRATVLLPLSAITVLGPEELEVVLAHELAHVRRADYLWNLVQTFAETIFFFHPAVWWIGGCLRTERELCCDDFVLKHCPNPFVYASALFHLEEQRARQPHFAMALNGGRSGSSLRMRILRILGETPTHTGGGLSRAFSISVALAGFFLLILPGSQVLASLHPVQTTALIAAKQQSPSATPDAPADPAVAAPAEPAPNAQPAVAQESATPEKPQGRSSAPAPEPKSSYIDRMKAAGYDVDLDKYMEMKIQNVTPEYAREMAQAGLGKLSADDLIACKIQGVTLENIAQLKQQGFDISSVQDAIAIHIFKVTPEFIAGMKAAGYPNIDTKKAVELRVQGVTPEYARSIAQQFPGATLDEIIQSKVFHIDENFIESARKLGFKNLNLDKLVQIRISGILDDQSVKP